MILNFGLILIALVAIGIMYLMKMPLFGMALTADRDTPTRSGFGFNYPVYQSVHIYAGALVCLNSTGYLVPGSTSTSLKVVGRAKTEVDNSSGSSGDLYCEVEAGVFQFDNSSAADEITLAEVGSSCFIVDDETVAKTTNGATRSVAGIILDVDADGVWVFLHPVHAATTGIVAANNGSDFSNLATTRATLNANKYILQIPVVTLVGTGVYRVVSPYAGTIKSIYSVIDGVLSTGDATLTAKIGSTAVTTGVITITQAGSAAGDVDTCSPSAEKTVAAGSVVSVTVGGTNATASGAMVIIMIET